MGEGYSPAREKMSSLLDLPLFINFYIYQFSLRSMRRKILGRIIELSFIRESEGKLSTLDIKKEVLEKFWYTISKKHITVFFVFLISILHTCITRDIWLSIYLLWRKIDFRYVKKVRYSKFWKSFWLIYNLARIPYVIYLKESINFFEQVSTRSSCRVIFLVSSIKL